MKRVVIACGAVFALTLGACGGQEHEPYLPTLGHLNHIQQLEYEQFHTVRLYPEQ